MGRIPWDEIAGFYVSEEVVCPNCITEDEIANVKEDDVITWGAIEDAEEIYFCDRGKKRL